MSKEKKKYSCRPEEKYLNICIKSYDGTYETKEACMTKCENYYIEHNLNIAGLAKETWKFYNFIDDMIKNHNISMYIKGGCVLGLKILQIMMEKTNPIIFDKVFSDFLKLKLIKDWDFSGYTKRKIDDAYSEKINNIALKHGLVREGGKSLIIHRSKTRSMINGEALFEISTLDEKNEKVSQMELPFTTMKIKVTKHNLKQIFGLAKFFYKYETQDEKIDLDFIKKTVSKLKILVHPCKWGFYEINKVDFGNLGIPMVKFITKFCEQYGNLNKETEQFIATHIQNPFRLFHRLPEKNIKKSKKIISFFMKYNINTRDEKWLMNTKNVETIIDKLTRALGEVLYYIYNKTGHDGLNKYIEGIEWIRTEMEYNKLFTSEGKKLANNILKKIAEKISPDEIRENLPNKNKETVAFYKLIKKVRKELNIAVKKTSEKKLK